MAARRISATDTAHLLHPVLHRTFPTTTFTLRPTTFPGGAVVDIHWTDGPTAIDVDDLTRPFSGVRYHPQTDRSYTADSWHCPTHGARVASTGDTGRTEPAQSRCCPHAELVHFIPVIGTARTISPAFRAELADAVRAAHGLTHYDPDTLVISHPPTTAGQLVWQLSLTTPRP